MNPHIQSVHCVFYRSTFAAVVMVITVVSTASSFVKPTANAYALNCFSIHLFYILAIEIRWYETVGLFCGKALFFNAIWHKMCFCRSNLQLHWSKSSTTGQAVGGTVGARHLLLGERPFWLQPLAETQLQLPARYMVKPLFTSLSLYPYHSNFMSVDSLRVCSLMVPVIICIIWYRYHSLIINQTHPQTRLRIWTLTRNTNSMCPLLSPGLLTVKIIFSNYIVSFHYSQND